MSNFHKNILQMCNAALTLFVTAVMLFVCNDLYGQIHQASPANWLYPDGNAQGTRHIERPSGSQKIDSMQVKWSSPAISGDVQPLIGNIVNRRKIAPTYPFAPNEIVAIVGDSIVILDATGRVVKTAKAPDYVKSISVLIDTLATSLSQPVIDPVIMGFETMEYFNLKDSVISAYLFGFDHQRDTVSLLKRLAIDFRPYSPNVSASIKPLYGKRFGNLFKVYAAVNTAQPNAPEPLPPLPPFFRGIAQFTIDKGISPFPVAEVGDDIQSRLTLGPEIAFAQPSLMQLNPLRTCFALPSYPSPQLQVRIQNNILSFPTFAHFPYLCGIDISGTDIVEGLPGGNNFDNYTDANGTRPQIRPYWIKLKDRNPRGGDSLFLLVAEEYRGIEGSIGQTRLHLFDRDGDPVTSPFGVDVFTKPPFLGGMNHQWSIAVGNIDGNVINELMPYYPNNHGNEIIATQTSKDFVVPQSRLFVLRFNSDDNRIPKPPPHDDLYFFDTIVTKRINGWVAAVNDLDGAPDGKDEIVLVDGSILMVIRMRDYSNPDFRNGEPFDTVLVHNFQNQTIASVCIADIEGDGLNDIIVTTHDSLYVLGALMTDILKVVRPLDYINPPPNYCVGDTVEIEWVNFLRGQDYVDIFFRELDNWIPTDELLTIAKSYPNRGDTIRYYFVADSSVIGKFGYFIVRSAYNPHKIADSSSSVRFFGPRTELFGFDSDEVRSGDKFVATGETSCVDDLTIEYSYASSTFTEWFSLWHGQVSEGEFERELVMPCVEFFECYERDSDSLIYIRAIGTKLNYSDTTAIIPIKARPALFPVVIDTCITACPTRTFRWSNRSFKFDCEEVIISASIDRGETFAIIANVPAETEEFIWQVPTGLPDSIIVRFCCDNSCIRVDAIMRDYNPMYIHIIAPNPVKPPEEVMEIVYRVPNETSVTIRIFDQNNKLVAEPIKNMLRSPGIMYCDTWDCRIHNGAYAANGMYYLSLELSDGSREIYPVYIRK